MSPNSSARPIGKSGLPHKLLMPSFMWGTALARSDRNGPRKKSALPGVMGIPRKSRDRRREVREVRALARRGPLLQDADDPASLPLLLHFPCQLAGQGAGHRAWTDDKLLKSIDIEMVEMMLDVVSKG